MTAIGFKRTIWLYYRRFGRRFLWRKTRDPYRILVSEIMLQQTQAGRVKEKYPEFLRTFPTVRSLARAPLSRVLRAWQGMGYNRRALFLKKIAATILKKFNGRVPSSQEKLESLPGIGHATASAIRAFAFNAPGVFIETNIRRVFIHFFFANKKKVSDKEILPLVKKTLDRAHPREWYWALMDYGTMLGEKRENPNRKSAHYARQAPFRGSRRELRGRILRVLLAHSAQTEKSIVRLTKARAGIARDVLAGLLRDRLIKKRRGLFSISS